MEIKERERGKKKRNIGEEMKEELVEDMKLEEGIEGAVE